MDDTEAKWFAVLTVYKDGKVDSYRTFAHKDHEEGLFKNIRETLRVVNEIFPKEDKKGT